MKDCLQLDKINRGLFCPYCECDTILIDTKTIYKVRSYGMAYQCPKCLAFVGCHKNTIIALGRVANKELREAKKEAHKYFDIIWKNKHLTRTDAYEWLSTRLEIPISKTHIGLFDIKQCKDTVYFSKQILNDMRRLDLDFNVIPETEYFEL